jgi:hypothetical protein
MRWNARLDRTRHHSGMVRNHPGRGIDELLPRSWKREREPRPPGNFPVRGITPRERPAPRPSPDAQAWYCAGIGLDNRCELAIELTF